MCFIVDFKNQDSIKDLILKWVALSLFSPSFHLKLFFGLSGEFCLSQFFWKYICKTYFRMVGPIQNSTSSCVIVSSCQTQGKHFWQGPAAYISTELSGLFGFLIYQCEQGYGSAVVVATGWAIQTEKLLKQRNTSQPREWNDGVHRGTWKVGTARVMVAKGYNWL